MIKRGREGRGREAQLWGISGSWDHGGKLAASNRKWRPLTSAKEWQFWGKKMPRQIQTDTHIHLESSSQGYEIVLFHIIRLCASHYCPVPPELIQRGLDRLFQDVWHISKMRSVCSFNWIQQCLITRSMSHIRLLPVVHVFRCRLYSSSAEDIIQEPSGTMFNLTSP